MALSDIINNISLIYDDIPNNTFIGPYYNLYKDNIQIKVTKSKTINEQIIISECHCFPINTKYTINQNTINIYVPKYYCGLTKSFIDNNNIRHISKGIIQSEKVLTSEIMPDTTDIDSYANVIIMPNCPYLFVFNYKDIRKDILLASLMCFNRLANSYKPSISSEVVDKCVLPFFGYNEKINDFNWNGIYTNEYNGPLPNIISKKQIQILYSLGMIKLAWLQYPKLGVYMILDKKEDIVKYYSTREQMDYNVRMMLI